MHLMHIDAGREYSMIKGQRRFDDSGQTRGGHGVADH
jgi:hypothetical protein